jgi:hypothetical protein
MEEIAMEVTVEVKRCKDCPHYVEGVFDDVGFGHTFYRCELDNGVDIRNPNIIPAGCPVLEEQKRRKT